MSFSLWLGLVGGSDSKRCVLATQEEEEEEKKDPFCFLGGVVLLTMMDGRRTVLDDSDSLAFGKTLK